MSHAPQVDASALDQLLAPFDTTAAPGFALGVALGGIPRYRRGVGLASVELPVPLSPTMRMRIGSTSKHFCVLAVMLLQEEGLVSIEDSPRKVLPELPAWADGMTIRQLMSHTSGMRDSLDLLLLSGGMGRPAAGDKQFQMLAALDSVNFAPGQSWNYNNGGYVLLSVIVERLSGMSLAEFLHTRIFEPIGMNDTVLRLLDTDLLPNSATLHLPDGKGGWTRGVFGPPVAGEGGIASTVDDMLRWLKHMAAPVVGSPETWEAMRTPHATHGYGLGLTVNQHRGLTTVHHAGGVIGGSCQMLKVVDCDLDLIIITNGQSAMHLYDLVDKIIDTCIPGLPPAPVDVEAPVIEGEFFSPASGRSLKLAGHEGKQVMTVGGMTLPATRHADGWITIPILPTDLRIRAADAEVSALDAVEFGADDRLERVAAPREADPASLAGRYASAAAGLTATVSGDIMSIGSATDSLAYALTPIGPDLWRGTATSAPPMEFTLEIDASGFLLTTGRTVRLRFERT
jgi:CubicO group peptidase (beta-lactamase class C family)